MQSLYIERFTRARARSGTNTHIKYIYSVRNDFVICSRLAKRLSPSHLKYIIEVPSERDLTMYKVGGASNVCTRACAPTTQHHIQIYAYMYVKHRHISEHWNFDSMCWLLFFFLWMIFFSLFSLLLFPLIHC